MSRILYRFMAILFLVSSYVFSQVQSEPETFPYIKLTDNLYKIEVDANSIVGSIGSDGVLLCDVGGERRKTGCFQPPAPCARITLAFMDLAGESPHLYGSHHQPPFFGPHFLGQWGKGLPAEKNVKFIRIAFLVS